MQFLIDNWLVIATALVSGGLLAWPAIVRRSAGPALSHHAATRLINDRDALVIDVRDPAAFAAGHLPNARTIPLADLDKRIGELPAKRPLVIVCETGQTAGKAAALIRKTGREDVHVLDGGLVAWRAAGLPVVR